MEPMTHRGKRREVGLNKPDETDRINIKAGQKGMNFEMMGPMRIRAGLG